MALNKSMNLIKVINTEEQFLEYVDGVLNRNKEVEDFRFGAWPEINIDIKGKRYQSSLPVKLMEGFICFQQSVDKAYSTILYDSSSRQKLTSIDKEILELVFTIEKGSTNATGGGGDWLNALFEKLDVVFNGMTGKEKIALIAIVAISIAGTYIGHTYIENQTKQQQEIAKVELEKERTKQMENSAREHAKTVEALSRAHSEQIKSLLEQQQSMHLANQRVDILRNSVFISAISEKPDLGLRVYEHLENGYRDIVKSVPDATKLEIGGAKLSKKDIKNVSKRKEVVRDIKEETKTFTIDSMKKKGANIILGVSQPNSEDSVNIKVDTGFLRLAELTKLHQAFEHSEELTLKYQAKYADGQMTEGRLISIEETDEEA